MAKKRLSDGDRANLVLEKMQKRDDAARAERRRRLRNGMSRALLHLTDVEMAEIEPILHGAIGRSVMSR